MDAASDGAQSGGERRRSLREMTAELGRLERERDSLAAFVRAEVVEALADGWQSEALAEFLWGEIPARGDAERAKERKARLTRIRQYHHQGRRELDLAPARPAYGGRGSPKPQKAPRPALQPGAYVQAIMEESDLAKRMRAAEEKLHEVIAAYNQVGQERRREVMLQDDSGVSKEQMAAEMGCSQARVSKMSNDARREAGLPVPPQKGGKKAAAKAPSSARKGAGPPVLKSPMAPLGPDRQRQCEVR